MAVSKLSDQELTALCHRFRIQLVELLHAIQTGHPGGSLSACEIITTLYQRILNVDPSRPEWEERDRFILSKGHAAPMLYLNLAERGFFKKEKLKSLRQINSMLQGHPCAHKTPGVELSTGPLGLGLSAGTGMAAAAKLKELSYYTYVLLGDGEIQEGVIWEGLMTAAKFKLDHLIAILDHNKVQLDGTVEEIMPEPNLKERFEAFGWQVIVCNGHCVAAITAAIEEAKEVKGKPIMIMAQTVKGKGISFMEGKNSWHGSPITDAYYEQAMRELKEVLL